MLHVTLGWTWLSPSRMWLSRSEGRKPVEQNILDKYVSDLTRKIQSYSSAIDNLQAFIDFVQDKPVRNISEKMERWRQGRFQYHPSWPELKGRNCKDVVNLWIQWKSSTKGWSQHKAEGAARTLGLNFAWLNGQLDQIALYKGQVSRLKTLVQAAMRVSIPRYIPPLSELAKAAFDKSQDAMVQDVERVAAKRARRELHAEAATNRIEGNKMLKRSTQTLGAVEGELAQRGFGGLLTAR